MIEFHYEGRLRRFRVQSIRAKDKNNSVNDGNESLLHCMKMLSIESPAQLWTVDWDCLVSIDEPPHEKVVHEESSYLHHTTSFLKIFQLGTSRGFITSVASRSICVCRWPQQANRNDSGSLRDTS